MPYKLTALEQANRYRIWPAACLLNSQSLDPPQTNYCTELDGNFQLLKERSEFIMSFHMVIDKKPIYSDIF